MNDPSSPPSRFDWVPGAALLRSFNRADLSRDVMSGLVVALVLIPSAIAYADLAKCSPVSGLYAALGGMIVFALFTSSRHVIAGPDAAVAIMVGAAVGPLSQGDPGKAVALSAWLAFLVAAILVVAAALRLGGAAEFLSAPVMLGFMNGAAIVILVSQLGKFTGIRLNEENTLLKLLEWIEQLRETHLATFTCGATGLAILLALRQYRPRVPGSIVVFVLAMFAGLMFDLPGHGIAVIGTVDTRMPSPVPPSLEFADMGRLAIAALGLAMLIFPEGILLSRAMADRHGYEVRPNRELVALGLANLAAGLLRSFSVGGSQSRTLLNSSTGGRTQLVSLVAAALLVAFVAFLGSWIAALANAAIAAILIYTAITLIDVREQRRLWAIHRPSALISIVTSIGVVALGVLPGILVGVVLSLLKVLSQISRPQDALLGRVPGDIRLHDVGHEATAKTIPGLVVYRFYGPLLFANVRFFVERLERLIANEPEPVRRVILDARSIPDLDVTAAEQVKAMITRLRDRHIEFTVVEAHLPLRQAAERLGLRDTGDASHYYTKLSDAVAEFEGESKDPRFSRTLSELTPSTEGLGS
jgi:SulP family sulfate permease